MVRSVLTASLLSRVFRICVMILSICFTVTFSAPVQGQDTGSPDPRNRNSRGRGNTFNPDIGFNGLFLYRAGQRGGREPADPLYSGYSNGLILQEAELQLSADVDPYLRAYGSIAIHHEAEADTTTTPATSTYSYHFEPEEVYAETIGLPFVMLKMGKFKAYINKHNLLHMHTYPFIDAPLINETLLGHEGLSRAGISGSILVPTPWFMELTLQGLNGDASDESTTDLSDSSDLFGSSSPGDMVGIGYLNNLFDLNDELTFEAGVSGASGENRNFKRSSVYGSDLTVKWKPEFNPSIRTLIFSTQYLQGEIGTPTDTVVKKGLAGYIQWQGHSRWWLQLRAENMQIHSGLVEVDRVDKQSVLLGFLPTEFSGFRLQYDRVKDLQPEFDQRVSFQMNFSIGAHPAHAY